MSDYLTESTLAERSRMLADGMQEISRREWLERVVSYGYRLDSGDCFNYVNTGNAISYRARAVGYSDTETGLSFAHFQGRRDTRFAALQDMRRNCFVFANGRIYEL